MSRLHIFSIFIASGALLTACSTSENAIVDDVYSVKPVEFPIGTDLTDETDYNAYVYNKEKTDREQTYYEDFRRQRNTMNPIGPTFGYRPAGMFIGYGMMNPYGYGYYGSPYGYYDPYWGSHYGYGYNNYGYGYGYNPYYSPYYSPYYGYSGYGSPYGNPYYSNYGSYVYVSQAPGNFHSGPRGSISGMGGVSSRSTVSLKSAGTTAPAPGSHAGRTAVSSSDKAIISTPVNNPGRPTVHATTSRPVSANREVGRPVNTGAIRPGTYNPEPARPATTVRGSSSTVSPGRSSSGSVSPTRNSNVSSPRVSTPSRTSQPTMSTPSRSSGSGSSGSSSRPSVKPGRP